MGLMVHSLEGIPEDHHRDYFIYLLDYGWKEPLSNALVENFGKMATLASQARNAVVIIRTDEGVHFSDEVLSWHNINGYETSNNDLLPAILVTNRHPAEFKKHGSLPKGHNERDLKLILFPLKKHCTTTTEVIELIQKIFTRIQEGKDLDNFDIVSEKKKNGNGNIASSLIIQPTSNGTTVAFNTIGDYFRNDK